MVSYDFSGQVAIVTGGANGIGRAIAERLRDGGAAVHVFDIAPGALPGVREHEVDVASGASVANAVGAVIAESGAIHVLSTNAGFTGANRTVEQTDPLDWRRIVEVNLTGVFECCRLVVPHMRRAGWGRIVNMASLAGKEGTPHLAAYSAAKAGVIAFTKSLAKELAQTQIRVNSVAPAAIETAILEQMSPQFVQIMIDKSPMRRLGTVQEAANLVAWLCSEDCTFNTGAVFDLSGGRASY